MIDKPLNEVIAEIVKRQMPSTFKKAVISKVNYQTSTADVFFPTSPQNIIKDVPFASNVNIIKITKGMTCRVDIFDESNINDMVIAYTYGSNAGFSKMTTGTATISTAGTAITHGLGDIPDIVLCIPTSLHAGITYDNGIYVNGTSTATYAYFRAPYVDQPVQWVAIKI